MFALKYRKTIDIFSKKEYVTSEAGLANVTYVYRAFGSQLGKLGTGEALYTYGGKELNTETDLYYFNARYYDASVDRFICIDPAPDEVNWYIYCNNNQLSFVDQTGLVPYKDGVYDGPYGSNNQQTQSNSSTTSTSSITSATNSTSTVLNVVNISASVI